MAENSCIQALIQSIIFLVSGYFTVLLLSRNRPTIYLDNFNIVSLRNTSSSSTNTAIYLELRVQNENSWIGVYYEDPLNLTITYLQSTISTGSNVIIERSTIKGFYQGNGEVKHIQASVVIQDLFSTTERPRRLGETNIMMYGPSKMIDFVIDLEADIKFKSIENKKSHLTMQSTVEVSDNTGTSVLKTIQMKYTSGSNKWGVWRWVLAVPLVSLIQGLLSLAFLLAFLFLSFVSLV